LWTDKQSRGERRDKTNISRGEVILEIIERTNAATGLSGDGGKTTKVGTSTRRWTSWKQSGGTAVGIKKEEQKKKNIILGREQGSLTRRLGIAQRGTETIDEEEGGADEKTT